MKKTSKDYILVAIQLLLFAAFFLNPSALILHAHQFIQGVGFGLLAVGVGVAIIATIQLNKNLSPFPTPKNNGKLVETGLYSGIRHPIYTGVLLTGFGLALGTDSGFRLILSVLLLILFYYKTEYEENRLSEKFPEYAEYKNRTGRFSAWW